MGTNVSADVLNYDQYTTEKYDQDIVRSIPGHTRVHQIIIDTLKDIPKPAKILELGVGTGLTAKKILNLFPKAHYIGIDFSEQMLKGAILKLKGHSFTPMLADYSKSILPSGNDIVVSVISIHHQETDEDKKKVFKKAYNSLNKGGIFIFGDLITYRDQKNIAVADAFHYHHLVENSDNPDFLMDWAHHHMYLNRRAPILDQIKWLKESGYRQVELLYLKHNTALICCKK